MPIKFKVDEPPDVMEVLSSDQKKSLVASLLDMEARAEDYRGNWDSVHEENWRIYRAIPAVRNKSWPWRNAANYFIPVAATATDILNSLLFDAMFSSRPEMVGEGIEDEAVARKLNRYFFGFVFSKQISLNLLANDWNLFNTVDGTSAVKGWWDDSSMLRRANQTRISLTDSIPPSNLEEVIQSDLREPTQTIHTREVVEVVQNQRPRIEPVDLSYLYVAPGTKASLNYPDCPWYYEKVFLSWEQLQEKKRNGWRGIDEELSESLREHEPPVMEQVSRDEDMLSHSLTEPSIEVQIWYMRLVLPAEYVDEDGKTQRQSFRQEGGIPEECIVWFLRDSQRIAKIEPLTRQIPDGNRPHVDNRFSRVGHYFYGQGLMDKLRHLQKLVNTTFNQQVDYGTIQNLPFFFYSPHMTGMLPDLSAIAPGQGIPVSEPRGVQFPRFQRQDNHFSQLFINAQQWIERVSSVTDFNAGRAASVPNAPRTARGMFQLLEQSNKQFVHKVQIISEAYKRMFRMTLNLVRANSEGALEFRYLNEQTGVLQRDSLDSFALQGEFDFSFRLNPNKVLEQQSAQNFFALMMQIPFLSQNPRALRSAAKDLAISFGKEQRFEEIWPEEAVQQQEAQLQEQQAIQLQQQSVPGGAAQQPAPPRAVA